MFLSLQKPQEKEEMRVFNIRTFPEEKEEEANEEKDEEEEEEEPIYFCTLTY